MKNKSVSVVIPNYNGRKILENNLPTVYRALESLNLKYEIIIPDDASTDESVTFLKDNYPEIIVIENKINGGFSVNINSGLMHAKNDLVLALNSDVSLPENFFNALLPHFQNPELFGVMSSLTDPRTSTLTDAAKYPQQTLDGIINATVNARPVDDSAIPSFFLSGANALMDRSKLEKLGFFNELFSPFYGEDVDLGLRAWRMGWICLYESKSTCYHEASSTIQAIHRKKRIRTISRRNKYIFHDLHLDGFFRYSFFLKLALDVLSRWLIFDFSFYSSFTGYAKKRKAIKTYRRENLDNKIKLKTSDVLKLVTKAMNQKPTIRF